MEMIGSAWESKAPLGVACTYCGSEDTWIGLKTEFYAKDVGTFSLAGVQMKLSVVQKQHPYAKCDGCGHESRGRKE